MALRWQFSPDDGGLISEWPNPSGHYLVSELDRWEGTWQAVYVGEDGDKPIKVGPLSQCLAACDVDTYGGKVPGPPDPPRPAKWNEVA